MSAKRLKSFANVNGKAERRAAWMTEFNDLVLASDPKHAGKIEWASAVHFYDTGLTPQVGADKYVENRK